MESFRKERPDVILIPGDLSDGHYVDAERKELDGSASLFRLPEAAIAFLCACVQIAPTFYSRGNHEWRLDTADLTFVESLGVCFLEDGFRAFGAYVIGGLRSTRRNGPRYVDIVQPKTEWLKEYEAAEGNHLLLCHHPESWPRFVADKNIELTISGHAHGGQWRLFGRGGSHQGRAFFRSIPAVFMKTAGCLSAQVLPTRRASSRGCLTRLN